MAETVEVERGRPRLDDDDAEIDALLNRTRCRRKALYQAPEFIQRLNSFEEVKAGSTATFQCKFKAFPKASIKWYKDDEDITEDGRYEVCELGADHLELRIVDCSKKDEGAYKCKAENGEGVASSTGYLSVTGSIKDKPLSAQPRKTQSEHMISSAPHLRTITEQRSVEEREAEVTDRQPPSPLTHQYIAHMQKVKTWPRTHNRHLDAPKSPLAEQNGDTNSQDNGQLVNSLSMTDDVLEMNNVICCDPLENEPQTTATTQQPTNTTQHKMTEEPFEHELITADSNQNMTAKNYFQSGTDSGFVDDDLETSEPDQREGVTESAGSQPNTDSYTEGVSDSLVECYRSERTRALPDINLSPLILFLLTLVSVTSAGAAATGMSPTLFVLFVAVASLLSFACCQLIQR